MTTLMTIDGLGKIVANTYSGAYHNPRTDVDEDIPYQFVEIKLVRDDEDETEKRIAIIDHETLYGLKLVAYSDQGRCDENDDIFYANTSTYKFKED